MNVTILQPSETPPQHAFAAPEHSTRDAAALAICHASLNRLLTARAYAVYCAAAAHINVINADERIVVYQPQALAGNTTLGFVGFCGLRRAQQAPDILAEMDGLDTRLLAELLAYPDVLSYGTLRCADDNYVNLVVLRTLDAIEQWRTSPIHTYAADVLSPRYYSGVRIHNGLLRNGISSPLQLTSTKYFDFAGTSTWRAIRVENS
jgi:hypothetical protein